LADIAQNRGEYTLSANYLIGIPLDSGHRSISNNTKLSYYVRISRLLLEDEDFVGAESYINRAGFLLDNSVEKVLQLQFKAAQARILDMKRQFLPAATKYYELSLDQEMHESERNSALKSAITCCILAGAGYLRI
jgi:COP9 signalosome complex subunit 4